MSGSGSGSIYERMSHRRLKALLKDPAVKRNPQRMAAIQRELAFRRPKGAC
jgi:hypothetical protein